LESYLGGLAAAILFSACFAGRSMAQQPGQRTFSSAEEASQALQTATQKNDEKAMLDILGPEGKRVISSGDDTQDAEMRANFARKYQQMHRLLKEPDGSTTLYIGAENWPTPIPLMKKGNRWYFDTQAGEKEILFRRVGENELSTIRVCEELAAAQKEYYASHQNQYAQQIFSDEGQHNGLYWKRVQGEPRSPIGPLVAAAVAEGYPKGQADPPTPFHGYYYRVLTAQGKTAQTGAKNYIVDGKMTDGFAFVAYPAEYRSSGVMTFIVDRDGVVYQKDLGKSTGLLGKSMKEYSPGPGWQKADDEQAETAGNRQNK